VDATLAPNVLKYRGERIPQSDEAACPGPLCHYPKLARSRVVEKLTG